MSTAAGNQPRLTACLLLALGAFLGSCLCFLAPPEQRLEAAIVGAGGGVLAVLLVGLQRILRPRLGNRTAFAAVALGYGLLLLGVGLLASSCPLRDGAPTRCEPGELAAFFLLGAASVALLACAIWPVAAAARAVVFTRAFLAERARLREEELVRTRRAEELDRRGAEKAQRIALEEERVAARRARRAARRAPAPTPTSPTSGGAE